MAQSFPRKGGIAQWLLPCGGHRMPGCDCVDDDADDDADDGGEVAPHGNGGHLNGRLSFIVITPLVRS